MSIFNQEWIALGIVAVAALVVGVKVSRAIIFRPLANWLLRSGRVKCAMRVRRLGGYGGSQRGDLKGARKEVHRGAMNRRIDCGRC